MKKEEEKKETNTNVNDNNVEDIYRNEELVFNCIKITKEDGIAELLQHLNNIPIEHLTSPSFINKLEHSLKIDSTGYNIPISNLIRNNYPSNSLLFLEYLKDKGINIKQLICSPQIYNSVLKSTFNLYGKVKEKIMLKNIEEKAQLELVKMLIELSLEHIKGNEDEMMRDALESRNLKIIKYFVSLNIGDIKKLEQKLFTKENALHIVLERNMFHYNKEQQKPLLKLIKYLVDQGVDIHKRNTFGETILHLAAKYHSIKMIKYLVSLGIDIHSLDNQKNNLLLSAGQWRYKNETLMKIAKYFISIGINIEHQNNDGIDFLLYSIEYGNFEFIKYIGSLIPSLKSPDRYNIISTHFRREVCRSLNNFNIEMIKYLDEIPCFAQFFDGRNKIKTKSSILFDLISFYSKEIKKIKFGKFKEVFQFFLNKRNNINSIDVLNQIAIQQDYNKISICWKLWDYLIGKGINLNHVSNHGSILHYLFFDKKKLNQEYGKYIMIRSMEINSQIVDHPKYFSLKDEDSFEDFKREEEENEEKVIKWKRGMAEILMKYPKILNLVLPRPSSHIFKFDEKSSQLVKVKTTYVIA